jgi:hypothetical protein
LLEVLESAGDQIGAHPNNGKIIMPGMLMKRDWAVVAVLVVLVVSAAMAVGLWIYLLAY